MVVTVKRVGGSVAVLIPKSVARELELIEGTELDLSTDSGAMTMRKRGRRARRPLKDLIPQMNRESYRRLNAEFNADGPVGREIL